MGSFLPRFRGLILIFPIIGPLTKNTLSGSDSAHFKEVQDLVKEPDHEPDDSHDDDDWHRRRDQCHKARKETCSHTVKDTRDLGPVDVFGCNCRYEEGRAGKTNDDLRSSPAKVGLDLCRVHV